MFGQNDRRPSAVIFGCQETSLTNWEIDFFEEVNPYGIILFARNCQDPDQIRALVDELREAVGREDAPILIDQEGGRVARLKPPHWREAPPAAAFAELARENINLAIDAVELNSRLLAYELSDLGITVDCLPVLDIPQEGADPIIGDRAYGLNPEIVAQLGGAACRGLLKGGVLPIIKHIPGHGRAMVDSHKALPVVDVPREMLENMDFAPFHALHDAPWAMTAHVVYSDIDPYAPATTSPRVIDEVIREFIGFDGVLISDDLSMHALGGSFEERTDLALEAGCDLVLHCNGEPGEMQAIANAVTPLSDEAMRRIEAAEEMRLSNIVPIDFEDGCAQLEDFFNAV